MVCQPALKEAFKPLVYPLIQEIDSVILEGGGTLNWSALQEWIVQNGQAVVATKLFGWTAA